MKNQFTKTMVANNAIRRILLVLLATIISFLFLGCIKEKLPKLCGYIGEKIKYPDYHSLYYEIRDTIIKDSMFVDISLFNISSEPLFVPLNNWYIDGWPEKYEKNSFDLLRIFPDYNKNYHCNLLLFCNGYIWNDTHKETYMLGIGSFPIINKIEPEDSLLLSLKIIRRSLAHYQSSKMKIIGNILFSHKKNHYKLINLLKLDEKSFTRFYKKINFTFDMNNPAFPEPHQIPELAKKPFLQYSDSTGIDIYSIYPKIKENTFYENLLLFRKLYLQYRKSGYNLGYELPDNFNYIVEKFNANPDIVSQTENEKYFISALFNNLFKETYCNSIIYRNY